MTIKAWNVGRVTPVRVESLPEASPAGWAEGDLPQRCAEHHGQGPLRGPIYHDRFSVAVPEGAVIGQLRVSSMSVTGLIWIEDKETQVRFWDEVENLRKRLGLDRG